MRGVSRRASRVAPLLAVFFVLTAAGAWAGETQTPPTDSPQARLQPLGGIAPPPPPDTTLQARLQPPGGVAAQARIQPPSGVAAQARIQPPGGLAAILLWLQSRLSVPHP